MTAPTRADLIAFLAGYVTENKQTQIARVLDHRTRYVTVALEDIYQPHNASAVLRTCECFGVQDVHLMEGRNRYRPNPGVSMGASHWLTLNRYNQEEPNEACVSALRSRGYRIVATTPAGDAVELDRFSTERGPFALLFGTEEAGLRPETIALADEHLRLPMFGFTRSYNVSVSVAIALTALVPLLHRSSLPWELTPHEKEDLTLTWYRRIVRRHQDLEERFVADWAAGGSSNS